MVRSTLLAMGIGSKTYKFPARGIKIRFLKCLGRKELSFSLKKKIANGIAAIFFFSDNVNGGDSA